MKKIMTVLAIILAALPLVSAAPAPAPLPLAVVRVARPADRVVWKPRAQACDEQSASYLVRHAIEREIVANGQKLIIPAGQAVGWSCESPDAAQTAFQERAGVVLAQSAQMIP